MEKTVLYLTLALSMISSAFAGNTNPAPTKYWAGGMFIGRPLKASLRGVVKKTMELSINYGGLPGSGVYLGTTMHASTKRKSVFEQFQKLDPNKNYVFEYEQPYGLNPVWEDTHVLVTAIREVKRGFTESKLPLSVETYEVRTGDYSAGERNGMVVEVQRWGLVNHTCTVTLNLGGHSQEGTEERLEFAIYGEKNCAYAESLLPYEKEVKVNYSQDMVEWWDANVSVIHKIEVSKPATETLVGAPDAAKPSDNVDPETYRRFKERLLNDPEFLESVRERAREAYPLP